MPCMLYLDQGIHRGRNETVKETKEESHQDLGGTSDLFGQHSVLSALPTSCPLWQNHSPLSIFSSTPPSIHVRKTSFESLDLGPCLEHLLPVPFHHTIKRVYMTLHCMGHLPFYDVCLIFHLFIHSINKWLNVYTDRKFSRVIQNTGSGSKLPRLFTSYSA